MACRIKLRTAVPRHGTTGACWHTYNVSADVRGSNVLLLGSPLCCDFYPCKPEDLAGNGPLLPSFT